MANIKLSKLQLHKIGQSWGFLGRLLGPLLKAGLFIIRNVLKPLTKAFTAAASAADIAIHEKTFGLGFTTLIISNEEMNHIMKIVKSLEDTGLLIEGVTKTIKNKAKEQKGGFLAILLLSHLGTSLSENLLIGKSTIRTGEGTIRAGKIFKCKPIL